MSLRELTALVLLYRACGDEKLRKRVLELVPDLTQFDQIDHDYEKWLTDIDVGFEQRSEG